jgi:hypothetical protein
VLTTATGYLAGEGAIPGNKRPNPAAMIGQALTVFDDPTDANIRKRLEQVVFDRSTKNTIARFWISFSIEVERWISESKDERDWCVRRVEV